MMVLLVTSLRRAFFLATFFNRVKFSFYESVKRPLDVTTTIPLKTLYSQGFPQATGNFDSVSMQMRDGYGFLESEQGTRVVPPRHFFIFRCDYAA